MCIDEVFKRIKEVGEHKNQKEMIETLPFKESFFFKLKRKEQHLSDGDARKLAELARLPTDYVLTINNIEKCKDAESLKAYKKILQALEYIHTNN